MLVVIVPYRDRKEHKDIFIPHIKKYLNEKNIEHHIIIVEQDNNAVFNRGKLRNIGFLEACKRFTDFYVCFHDIDILPEFSANIQLDYSRPAPNTLRHQYGEIQCLGCLIIIDKETFQKLNGYPNNYWGWGFEDESVITRCIYKHVDIDRNNFVQRWTEQNTVKELSHNKPSGLDSQYVNRNRALTVLERIDPKSYLNNGISTCIYFVNKIDVFEDYTHIYVDVKP